MTLFTIDALDKTPPLRTVRVSLHEWGEGLFAYIGQMTADERDERLELLWVQRKERREQETQVGFRAFCAAACICDENRNWLASTPEAIDALADKFGKQNAIPVSRMFDHACNLNGLTPEDVEELEKN